MTILWDELLERYRWEIFSGLIGITLLGIGIFWWKSGGKPESVQILSAQDSQSENSSPKDLAMVDISGAVATPGVYELPLESRIEDALQAAGGINETADSKWIEVNLNRAAKITDGMKLYIPAKSDSEASTENGITANEAIAENGIININSASVNELDTLPGIGPVTADKIIAGRPYGRIEELLERKIVSQKVFDQIKEKISPW